MALILHIETATSVCSAALSRDGQLISIEETNDPRSHAKKLSPFIDKIFKSQKIKASDLDAVSISLGPGSYTGLRIGVSTVKGIAYGADLPVIGISTLEALACRITKEKASELKDLRSDYLLCPMIDARRMEVYTAFFSPDMGQERKVQADIIEAGSYSEFLEAGPVVFFGDGSDKCREIIKHTNAIFISGVEPSARYMIRLAELYWERQDFLNTAYFEPFYLKDFIATVPKNKIIPPPKTT